MLSGISCLSAYNTDGVHKKLSFTDGLPNVGKGAGIYYIYKSGLRSGKQQLFWESFSGIHGLYSNGISFKMAE